MIWLSAFRGQNKAAFGHLFAQMLLLSDFIHVSQGINLPIEANEIESYGRWSNGGHHLEDRHVHHLRELSPKMTGDAMSKANGTMFSRRDDYSCGPGKPCANGACCGGSGYCGYGTTPEYGILLIVYAYNDR
jgi:hypothetical protein